jgi:hypothetical protein
LRSQAALYGNTPNTGAGRKDQCRTKRTASETRRLRTARVERRALSGRQAVPAREPDVRTELSPIMKMFHDIFISHSEHDRDAVSEIRDRLRAEKVDVYVDQERDELDVLVQKPRDKRAAKRFSVSC